MNRGRSAGAQGFTRAERRITGQRGVRLLQERLQ